MGRVSVFENHFFFLFTIQGIVTVLTIGPKHRFSFLIVSKNHFCSGGTESLMLSSISNQLFQLLSSKEDLPKVAEGETSKVA